MTAPRVSDRSGRFLLLHFAKRPSVVILSAAGAKDLLSPRCEGPAFGDDTLRPHAPSVLKQVLRSRAFRALAQDDTPPRVLGRNGRFLPLPLRSERALSS